MERIKQALEMARMERQKAHGPGILPPRTGNVASPGMVTYTQTRVVEIEPDKLREKRIIIDLDQNAYTEAFRILRTQVLQRLQEKNWNSLAITSPGVNEGKTLTAINLAIGLAMEVNYTVLLVDADLRHPSVHDYFDIQAEHGLSDYLTADKPLSELLIHPGGIPGFVILPGGKPLANSAEMLNSPKMVRLVEELKTRYPSRIVLFDMPPLLTAADTLAFSPYVDAALLVIEEGKTQADDAKRAMELLDSTNVIGTVLNKSWTNMPDDGKVSTKLADRLLDQARLASLSLTGLFKRLRRNRG